MEINVKNDVVKTASNTKFKSDQQESSLGNPALTRCQQVCLLSVYYCYNRVVENTCNFPEKLF